jgi:hypothetical protein
VPEEPQHVISSERIIVLEELYAQLIFWKELQAMLYHCVL